MRRNYDLFQNALWTKTNLQNIEEIIADTPLAYEMITVNNPTKKSNKDLASDSAFANDPVICFGLKTVAITILVGDGVHNFMDGVAVAVSYAYSPGMGIATSVAIILHELPHEIGDFVILLKNGLSYSKAVFLNFLSALTAFLGLFFGLAVADIGDAVPILLSMAAAMFLYVAWMDMLIQMKYVIKNHRWSVLIIQVLGLVIGYLCMFLIAWYEHKIHEFAMY